MDLRLIPGKERRRRQRSLEEWVAEEAAVSARHLAYQNVPRAPIRLLCMPLRNAVNHGGILRVAEAFRVEQVTFSPEDDGAVDMSGHRGTGAWQPHRWLSADEALSQAKAGGYATVALSLSERAVAIEHHTWRFPVAIVLGSEVDGVPAELEARCDATVAIPLFGLVTSLNVATAAALATAEALRAYRAEHPEFQPIRAESAQLLAP